MISNQELVDKFIASINQAEIKNHNTRTLFALGFVGLTGSGKTTVAQKIGERLGLYVATSDKVRRFLNFEGISGESPDWDLVHLISKKVSQTFYNNSISHIIDADLIKFHELTRENAREHGAKLYIIHVDCPEKIILERLDKRQEEIQNNPDSNFSRVGKEEYFKRKELHESLPLPEIFFKIDTSKNLDLQIELLSQELKNKKII